MKRTSRAGFRNFLLWATGIFLAWQLLQTDLIGNAVLEFVLGGVVPGTHVVLSPDTMLYIVVGILGSGVLFLAIRLGFIVGRRHSAVPAPVQEVSLAAAEPAPTVVAKPAPIEPQLELVPALPAVPADDAQSPSPLQAEPTPQPLPYSPIVLPKRASPKRAPARMPVAWLRPVFLYVGASITGMERALRAMGRGIRLMVRWWHISLVSMGAWIMRTMVGGWRAACRSSVAFWQWASPYLWQFDGWVEQQVHRMLAWLRKKAHQNDDVSFILGTVQESVKRLKTLRPSAAKASTERKSRP